MFQREHDPEASQHGGDGVSRSTTTSAETEVRRLATRLADAGANLTVELPGADAIEIGADPARARVVFRTADAVAALLRGDHLALAEAYLHGRIDLTGEARQALFVTDQLDLGAPPRLEQALVWLRFVIDRRRFARQSIAHHYDRSPAFFLAWLDRSRSYTHGFYASPDDDLTLAQARKLQFAIDALGLRAGMGVLDVGCGWGAFLEYAGTRGIRVHGITLSREQHAFVSELIRTRNLPCSVECVDFFDYQPAGPFEAAVFMGSLEHIPDYRFVGRFLDRHLRPDAAVYADFVTTGSGRLAGAFLRKYIFPGVTGYVDLGALVGALARAGFHVRELTEDTLSCAYTVRDWARALESGHADLAARFGELPVRAFLLYLWSSHHFLATNRTQAYHLVAARTPREQPAGAALRAARGEPG
jgi:cyclopropane-fatty-acyl-phospholipid synthase